MSNNKEQVGWNKRVVLDYSKIHGNNSKAFQALFGSMRLEAGMQITDIMCGHGAVSEKVLEKCKERRIKINLTLTDAFSNQIQRSRERLAQYEGLESTITRRVEDARAMAFRDESLDIVIIKNALHEVRMPDQIKILRESYRALRQGGEIFLWITHGQTQEVNKYFAEIVRKKDEIAGFSSLVRNRYFSYRTEVEQALGRAGFDGIETIYSVRDFVYNTKELSKTDFGDDERKLQEYNRYVEAITPGHIKPLIDYSKNKEEIILKVMTTILKAKK